MASSHLRISQRTRVPPHRKVDENANRHIRQPSGIPLGASRLAQKDAVGNGSKLNQQRSILSEVTTTTINRKENVSRLNMGKEEVGHKRVRSGSVTEAARVPLAPKSNQPNNLPARVPLSRTHRQQVSVSRRSRIIPDPPIVIEEDEEDLLEDAVMDVEEDHAQDMEEAEDPADVEADSSAEHEVEQMVGIEEDAHTQAEANPRVWPNITPERNTLYEKRIGAIREVFEDFADDCDPTMVSEYADEIFAYMAELEEEIMPNPDYMTKQTDLTWDMREMLVDWLQQIHIQYRLLPETLWIAVNIMDRFLSERVVSRHRLQLVGLASMFIASKYEEIVAPSIDEFVSMANGAFEKEDILKGERIILQVLGFHVSHYCSPYSWMRKISKADDYDLQTRTLSKFLTEVTLMDHRFLRVKPSLIAAVGMYSARTMLGGDWNEAFIFHSGYTEEQLITGHQYIAEKLNGNDFTSLFIYKKYAHKKFLKASTFASQWARQQAGKSGAEALLES